MNSPIDTDLFYGIQALLKDGLILKSENSYIVKFETYTDKDTFDYLCYYTPVDFPDQRINVIVGLSGTLLNPIINGFPVKWMEEKLLSKFLKMQTRLNTLEQYNYGI